ncbi:MAG: DsrH/TusB family sulfur relay protein [Chloroflexi bacterium]|nr:DsrH/TusB family sulfur relay protein [Chloroflexota bacterium]
MANIYLLDLPFGRSGLDLARSDADASVVLVQDGVYLDARAAVQAGMKVYAIRKDAEQRGLAGRLPASVELIDYGRLVDLIVEHKVVNFT